MLVSRLLGWTLIAPQVKEAASLAARAAELDDSDPWAHLALGYAAHMMRRTEGAQQEFQRAIDLNPNFAAAYGYFGFTLTMVGRSDEAIAYLERAIRMESAGSTKRDIQYGDGDRSRPCEPLCRGYHFRPQGHPTA